MKDFFLSLFPFWATDGLKLRMKQRISLYRFHFLATLTIDWHRAVVDPIDPYFDSTAFDTHVYQWLSCPRAFVSFLGFSNRMLGWYLHTAHDRQTVRLLWFGSRIRRWFYCDVENWNVIVFCFRVTWATGPHDLYSKTTMSQDGCFCSDRASHVVDKLNTGQGVHQTISPRSKRVPIQRTFYTFKRA
jgi:hypothetical protein